MMEEMRETATPTAAVADDVRARRFTLVGERGSVRAALGAASDGSPGLWLYDGDDRPRAELALDASGATNVKLHDGDGDVCAWLAVGRHGAPSLYLRGGSRHGTGVRGHAQVSVDEHGCPLLSLHDSEGRARVLLSLDEQSGMAGLSYTDEHGNSCLLLGEDAHGRLRLVDVDGRARGVPVLPLERPGPAAEPAADPDVRLAAVAERLARLERGRLLRRTAGALVVLAAALAGVLGGRLVPPSAPASAPAPERAPAAAPGPVVYAEEVVLTDHKGGVRARLGVLADGTPFLRMTDPSDRSAVELGVPTDSGPLFRLNSGRSTIVLDAPPDDLPSLGLYDRRELVFQAPSNVARFIPPEDLWR
jgi:hypothetical protein